MISSLASKDLAIKNGFNENKLFYIPLGTNSYDIPLKRNNNEEYIFFWKNYSKKRFIVVCEKMFSVNFRN